MVSVVVSCYDVIPSTPHNMTQDYCVHYFWVTHSNVGGSYSCISEKNQYKHLSKVNFDFYIFGKALIRNTLFQYILG